MNDWHELAQAAGPPSDLIGAVERGRRRLILLVAGELALSLLAAERALSLAVRRPDHRPWALSVVAAIMVMQVALLVLRRHQWRPVSLSTTDLLRREAAGAKVAIAALWLNLASTLVGLALTAFSPLPAELWARLPHPRLVAGLAIFLLTLLVFTVIFLRRQHARLRAVRAIENELAKHG